MTSRVLFVCTGNVCRSPMAERLLRGGLAARRPHDAGSVLVGSAGTRARVGEPMTSRTAALVERYGGDAVGHAARPLTWELLAEADLVLTLGREHRSEVVTRHPGALRVAFTLREVARLLPSVSADVVGVTPQERLLSMVPLLAPARGRSPAPAAEQDDVVDPYRRGRGAYERCAAQLVPAVTSLLDALAPPA